METDVGVPIRRSALKAPLKLFQPPTIERILVPIDFSRESLKSIPYALAISRQFGADVHLLHVLDTSQYLSPSLMSLTAVVRAEWNERLKARLKKLASRYRTGGLLHVLEPAEGVAYKEICSAARHLGADLILVATHGYTGFRRAFLGSTAERIVQHSSCPVLIVRHRRLTWAARNGHRADTAFTLNKILVPTDLSDCAKVAFTYAVDLAREFHAQLSLVHVINPNAYPFGDEFAALHAAQLIREASRAARKKMGEMLAKTGVRYTARVEHGLPAREICAAAKRDVDLIVTSTHGRTGLGHVLIGSVAEHIVRCAHCPILVIPARNKLSNNQTHNPG